MEGPTKTCKACSLALPLSEFYRHERMQDGHINQCKACVGKSGAAYYQAHRERIRERERAYRQARRGEKQGEAS